MTTPAFTRRTALLAGHYVRSSRCGRWVGPSDPGWLPDEHGGVECSLCVLGIDLGPGLTYPCRAQEKPDE